MMPTAAVVLVLSSALLAAFVAAGLPITVKKGSAPPVVDDHDMVVVPGHSVGRGEVHLLPKTEQNASSSSPAAPPLPKGASKAPVAVSDKDAGATTEFLPNGPSGPGKVNSGALLRSFYVFMGLGFIVIMYLVARSVRLKQKVTRVHKYGIIADREDMEMAPLEAEDDEDDVVFELPNNS